MQKKTILIVDDEHQVANLLKLVFTRKGYQVRAAASGNEALKVLSGQQNWWTTAGRPGLTIS